MGETFTQNEESGDSLTTLQIEKLKLEIENLKSKSKGEGRLPSFIPLISVVVAVGGFLFGIYQFRAQQEKERVTKQVDQTIKIQSQIREDVEQLLKFTRDEEITVARVRFLLDDLQRTMNIPVHADTGQTAVSDEDKKTITSSLITLISDDCDFSKPRDVRMVNTVLNRWDYYKSYMKERDDVLAHFLSKYRQGIHDFHILAPSFFSQLSLDLKDKAFVNPLQAKDAYKVTPERLEHFQDLLIGFEAHLDLVQNAETKQRFIKYFQGSLCNPTLTEQWFKIRFDTRDEYIRKSCPE
jgi:hypothetical protein